MFSHYDQNNNGRLEAEELWQAAERDHLGQLSASCILADMLLFDDPDADGTLDINEFYTAFSKLYSKWTPLLRKSYPFFLPISTIPLRFSRCSPRLPVSSDVCLFACNFFWIDNNPKTKLYFMKIKSIQA